MTNRQREIMAVWQNLDEGEPEISTEQLIERVAAISQCDTDTVLKALDAKLEERRKTQMPS